MAALQGKGVKTTIRLTLRFCNLAALLFLIACNSIENYDQSQESFYSGQYAASAEPDGVVKVITWNIRFGESVETAVAELQQVEGLQNPDILLLKEMDEEGVEQIAETLHYNYVYYPASVHNHHDKNFGNAILSTWPITQSAKIALPHENPKNGQTRTAVRAVVSVEDVDILVYSVHTETLWLSAEKRAEQIEAIIADIEGESAAYILVGGDFNTAASAAVAALEEQFAAVDMERLSAGAEPTVELAGIDITADHIFAKGGALIENGVWTETESSDHYPVWVEWRVMSSE